MRRRAFLVHAGWTALSIGLGARGRGQALGAPDTRGGAMPAVSRQRLSSASVRARVVILGGGFAGATCALHLKRLAPRLEVLLIDADSRYHSCPMSNRVIAGMRPMQSITLGRQGLTRAGIRCLAGRAVAIDAERRQVRLERGGRVPYDRLVVAPGIRFLWERIEGLDESAAEVFPHAWAAGAQTENLARQLAAMRAGGVFAISVPGGLMRCPPGPFERASLAAALFKARNPRAKILILDANNRFPRQDVFTAQWRARYGGMIEWVPVVDGGAVTRVDAREHLLYGTSGAHRVDVGNVIPPQAPASLAAASGLASGHGWCPVEPEGFESTEVAGVHVIGDACIAGPMPKSASAAHAQALRCAAALAARLAGGEMPRGEMDSVCYGFVDRDQALAIHGRFEIAAGSLRAMDDPAAGTETSDFTAQARNAESWYRAILADSFGA